MSAVPSMSRPSRRQSASSPSGDGRSGSIKRVASAVGEGAMAVLMLHQYLALLDAPSPIER